MIQFEAPWRRVTAKTLVISSAADSVEVESGCCLNMAVTHVPHEFSEEVDLAAEIRKPSLHHLYFRRPGGLGDVIVALAGARAIARAYPNLTVTLGTKEDWFPFLNLQSEVKISGGRPRRRDGQLIVDLNLFFELDHAPNTVKVNRVDRVLGIFDLEQLTPVFDLEMPAHVVRAVRPMLPGEKPYIAVSVRRMDYVSPGRTPPEPLVAEVCRQLSKDFGIYIIEGHQDIPWAHEIGAVVFKKSSLVEATALLSLCDVVMCPDSGAMWLGHVTRKPTVLWAGPTPGGLKMNRHPLWPFGHRVIQTNDWINCPSCFEHEEACGWSHKCTSAVDPERFVRESVTAVYSLVSDLKS